MRDRYYEAFTRHVERFGPELGIFATFFLAGVFGLHFHAAAPFVPMIWPAEAVALAAVFVYGYEMSLAVALGSFALYLTATQDTIFAGYMAFGAAAAALVGAYLLKRVFSFDPSLHRVRDTVALMAVALVQPALKATSAASALWLFQPPAQAYSWVWWHWWSASAIGILIAAPLLLKWTSSPFFQRTRQQYAELFLSSAAVALAAFLGAVLWPGHTYFIFIPLMWVALRNGPRGATLAIFLGGSVAVLGALLRDTVQQFYSVEMFIAVAAGLFLVFTAIVEERKRAEREVASYVEELEHALDKISSEDEAKKNFLAILAHELRNPLAAMLSSIELLKLQGMKAQDAPPLLQTIHEHVHTMRTMLDDVLDISRISRNKLTLHKEIVPLDAIIDRSVRSVQPLVRNRRHKLVVTKPHKPLYVEGDIIRLEQIIVNLLNNAAKYTNPGGLLELSVSEAEGSAVISLKDNGIGISKPMLKRIFEPFFQVKRGKLATEGLGVGLPLTKQLVEMHGGAIEARSPGEGKGSEFVVRLPLPQRLPRKTSFLPMERQGGTLRSVKNKRSILVVDDNETAAQALGKLLEMRGHQVHLAYNGLDAVDKARELLPDIIVLDIGLPDIDGYEVVRILQGDTEFPSAIIALTGYGQAEDRERALQTGFHHHLTKPVGLRELERAFKKVVRV